MSVLVIHHFIGEAAGITQLQFCIYIGRLHSLHTLSGDLPRRDPTGSTPFPAESFGHFLMVGPQLLLVVT